MLITYYLTRIYGTFFILCALFSFIFTASNILIKISFANVITLVPFLFASMFPLMLLFSIPIASCMAVYITIYSSLINNEFIFIHFARKAKNALIATIALFSFSILPFYIPLTFQWAPQAYFSGKQILLNTAKKKLFNIKANALHTNIPGIAIYFKKKYYNEAQSIFHNLFLTFNDKQQEQYFFSAKKGILEKSTLYLQKGTSLHINKRNQYFYSKFETTTINLEALFEISSKLPSKSPKQTKFLTWKDFFQKNKKNITIEKHKRIAQIIWQLLFPFLAFWGIFILSLGGCASLASGILLSGFFFLIMHMAIIAGQAHYYSTAINITIMYATIVFTFVFFLLLYKKKAFK